MSLTAVREPCHIACESFFEPVFPRAFFYFGFATTLKSIKWGCNACHLFYDITGMEDKNLISKLQMLKEISPRENWVLYTKNQIISSKEEAVVGHGHFMDLIGRAVVVMRHFERPAFVLSALSLIVLGSTGYGTAKSSLPGDTLYPVRVAIEKVTLGIIPGNGEGVQGIEVAKLRLEDLQKVVDTKKDKNLASAKEEFAKSVAVVSTDFKALVEKDPAKALQVSKELIELQKGQAQLELVLGAKIGTDSQSSSLNDITKVLVETELNDLVTRALSSTQKALLYESIVAYQAGKYDVSLEKIWEITN